MPIAATRLEQSPPGSPLSLSLQKDVLEPAFAECPIDCEITIDAGHAQEVPPFSQRDKRGIGKVSWHIAVLVEKSGNPREVG